MTQRNCKKVSIRLSQLPKIRHHSTHFQSSSSNKQNVQIQRKKQKNNSKNLNQSFLSTFSKTYHHKKFPFANQTNNHNQTYNNSNKTLTFFNQKKKTKLQKILQTKFNEFKDFTNMNQIRFSQTFYRKKEQKNQQTKKINLQKKKVFNLKKQQNFIQLDKDGQFPLLQGEQIYKGPVIVLDYKIQMTFLKHYCYDSSFQLSRVGCTINCIKSNLYLFGGCPNQIQTILPFHQLKITQTQLKWSVIKSQTQPSTSLMYHTSNTYKQYLIFIGGFSLQKLQNKTQNRTQSKINKHYNSFIYVYNTQTNSWQFINWGIRLKHHTATIVGNNLLVHGGVNDFDQTQNKFYWISLSPSGNFALSKIQDFTSSLFLSHHAMINTLGQQLRLRAKLAVDGFLIFGGKKDDQTLSNQLYQIQAKRFKLNEQDMSQTKKWNIVEVKGPKPQPRMCHTFDILPNKGLCVLIGGINSNNEYLSDLWIFDMFGLNWIQIQQVPLLKQTKGIAYHSTTVKNSDIYLYGGIQKAQTKKYFYLIQTEKFKRQNSKHQTVKKFQTSTNFISFKAFQ